MTQTTRPQRVPSSPVRDESQQTPRETTQPLDYERHLEAEHNLLVDSQQGWPTEVRRYRLFHPMQGQRREKTLVAFVGTRPAALSYFFRYIHPTTRAKRSVGQSAWRR